MARNSEKAQSMLYRFREQQAVEMGMGNRVRGERRPRMASSVSSLRECERWRGDIMKDISRKVTKIQDSTLTDYEIRDLNDEINQLMREKRHWESQIVNLGGANYKRAQTAMFDDGGREVPGTRGYKYFGRARDLPGVKEMFTKSAQAATEESARNASFQMFRNQGPEYFGDTDEMDAGLAAEEEAAQRQDWERVARESASTLGLDDDAPLPAYPEPSKPQAAAAAGGGASTSTDTADGDASGKRKSPEPEEAADAGGSKKKRGGAKGKGKKGAAAVPPPPPPGGPGSAAPAPAPGAAAAAQAAQAALAASFMSVFDAAALSAPVQPSQEEMGKILLERRKTALRDEYGV